MVKAEEMKVPGTSIVGVGVGLSVGEFVSEFAARATGQVKWVKVGIKGLLKFLVFLIFYGVASRVAGLWSLFFEVAGYGSMGSWLADIIFQLYPGGVIGMAETTAVAVRTAMVGAEKVAEEMAREELKEIPVEGITVK